MRTLFGFILFAVAAVTGGVWYMNGRPVERPQFRTLEIARGELLLAVSATGTVEPVEVIEERLDVRLELGGIEGATEAHGMVPLEHAQFPADLASELLAPRR